MQKATPSAPIIGHATPQPLRAIGLMCLAWIMFACLDTTAKYLAVNSTLPASEVIWMRFFGQLIAMIVALGLLALPRLVRTHKPIHQLLRSLLMLGSTAFNFYALKYLRLDQTVTIGFLTPLTVAILAGPVLGEWIGWRRAVAIMIGFGGILVALRPGFAAIHPAFLLSFCGMLCYAAFSLATRYLAAFDRAEVTLFYSLVAGAVLVAPFAFVEWQWPADRVTWVLLSSLGILGGLGHYIFIVAHRYAPASTIAPFLYVSLLTHSIGGYLVFNQVPDTWTLSGAGIVILSGLYLLQRERTTLRAPAVVMTSEATPQR